MLVTLIRIAFWCWCRRGCKHVARESSSDGVITAPHWRGPYTMHGVIGNQTSPLVEDPFVWQDKRGRGGVSG